MGIGDAAHLAANTFYQLGTALSYLRPDGSGYITAEEYERISGEELDECSTKGRKMIANLAARTGVRLKCRR
jgi:hypothetical protein